MPTQIAPHPFALPLQENKGLLPALAQRLGQGVLAVFGVKASPYLQRKVADAVERSQVTRDMPAELADALPQVAQQTQSRLRYPRYAEMGVDARFAFAVTVPAEGGESKRILAKHLVPLFDGADHSFRPGSKPAVLLNVAKEITSVDAFITKLNSSPNLLSAFPGRSADQATVSDLSLRDLVKQNTQSRHFVSWALASANPDRFSVVHADGEMALLDSQKNQLVPCVMLEKAWNVNRFEVTDHGLVMNPDPEIIQGVQQAAALANRATVAPDGYEDATGFHYGKEPALAPEAKPLRPAVGMDI